MYIRDVVIYFGKARCGKGDLSDRFERKHGFLQLGFMNTLYRFYQAAYGIPLVKEEHLRPFLQDVGTNIVRQWDPDFHTRCLVREAKRIIESRFPLPHLDLVINDARTSREGNREGGQLPKLIQEITGRPARKIVSCFIEVSPEVQRHIMGEEEYNKFVSSGRSKHLTEPDSIDTDLTAHNRLVGLEHYLPFLDETETRVLASLRGEECRD